MKRTELKRKSPMKRKPAKKNKVPGLAAEYKADFPYDEWFHEFGMELQQYIGRINWNEALETNHIWTNPRVDRLSNFVNLGGTNHRFFHKHTTTGRILCLIVKLKKGEAEIAWYEQHRRIPSLLSWVESLEVYYQVGDWARKYWKELVDLLGKEQG